MPEKVVAVVFARNEKDHLPRALNILASFERRGLVQEAVVVNDASEDGGLTAKIAKDAGAIVVTNPTRIGKRGGFVMGATKARELGADVMLSLDADMLEFPRRTLEHSLSLIDRGALMVVPQQMELRAPTEFYKEVMDFGVEQLAEDCFDFVPSKSSHGFRVIKMKALEPLFQPNTLLGKKWKHYLRASPMLCRINVKPEFKARTLQASKLWGVDSMLETLLPRG